MERKTEQQIVFLQSKDIILRPIEKEDISFFTKWINDPEIRNCVSNRFPVTRQDEEKWFDNLAKRGDSAAFFSIFVNEKLIGSIEIRNIQWIHGTATTGTLIGEKEYRGKGYGSKAKMLLLYYAFNTLGLRKISSEVIAFNERSRRYAVRCGYKEEGRLKDQDFNDGKYHDRILMSIFKEDWLPLWIKWKKENM